MLSGARSSLRIAVNSIGFEVTEMDDDLEFESKILECKYLAAQNDYLLAHAKRLILEREAREERRKRFSLHAWLVRIFLWFPVTIMLGICNTLLFLPFDDDS
jgi:hypothetical protein